MKTPQRKRRHFTIDITQLATTALLFDTLPYDCLICVLRHLSNRPYRNGWKQFVASRDAFQVTRLRCPLGEIARDTFVELNILDFSSGEPSRSFLSMEKDVVGDNFILAELAPRLRTLELSKIRYEPAKGATILSACSNLRKLVIGHDAYDPSPYALGGLFEACGSVLEELHIRDVSDADSYFDPFRRKAIPDSMCRTIASRCTSLQVLTIEHEACKRSLLKLFRAVGGNLRKLSMAPPNFQPRGHTVREIAPFCRKLEDVEFFGTGNWEVAEEFVMALESNLRVLRVKQSRFSEHPPTAIFQKVFERFPNIDVHAQITCYDAGNFLRLMGERLRGFEFSLDSLSRWEQWNGIGEDEFVWIADVAQSNPNIEEMSLSIMDVNASPFLNTFLSAPRPVLRKLKLELRGYGAPYLDLIDILAQSLSSLEEFEFMIPTSLKRCELDTLIRANTNLKRLHLKSERQRDFRVDVEEQRRVVGLIRNLRSFQSLVELDITTKHYLPFSSMNLIADACVELRRTQYTVVVNSKQYSPVPTLTNRCRLRNLIQ